MRQNWRSPGLMPIVGRTSPFTVKIRSVSSGSLPHEGAWGFNATQESGGIASAFNGLATYDEHLLAQVAEFGEIAVHPFDDNGAGHAVERLAVTLTVRMRVIPEEPRRMIRGNFDDIVERVPRHGHHVDHIVLRRLW